MALSDCTIDSLRRIFSAHHVAMLDCGTELHVIAQGMAALLERANQAFADLQTHHERTRQVIDELAGRGVLVSAGRMARRQPAGAETNGAMILRLRLEGIRPREIAAALNAEGRQTIRRGRWTGNAVSRRLCAMNWRKAQAPD